MAFKIKKKNPLWSPMVIFMPLALIFGIIGFLRNLLYDKKVIRPVRFAIPTIGVGNLAVGGTGKSPHIEYLAKILSPYIEVASLSRGYGRKTTGTLEVMGNSSSYHVGDEPLVLKMKFPNIGVFVGSNRAFAVPELVGKRPQTNVVLLDDVFQHRSVEVFENMLLTEYNLPFYQDFLLPVGALRELPSGAKRANTIIVTKCPPAISPDQEKDIIAKIKPNINQKVFFSTFDYGLPYRLFQPTSRINLNKDMEVVLFSAIAGTDYLMEYLKNRVNMIHSIEFSDHHYFTADEITQLHKTFSDLKANNKIILTTEKDAVRLALLRDQIIALQLPIFILPIEVKFIGSNGDYFDSYINTRLLQFEA